MNTTERDNLLEVWDKLCELIDQKGSVIQHDHGQKNSELLRFNQIKLNRNTALWQSMMALLDPLTEEEVQVLLDLAKPNDTHAVYQSKVSTAIIVSIPLGLFYLLNVVLQNFNLGGNEFLSGPVLGGFIGAMVAIFILGGYLVYKQLAFRWLSMELSTCLETALAIKKAERINFKKYELPQTEDKRSKIILKKTPINIRSKK